MSPGWFAGKDWASLASGIVADRYDVIESKAILRKFVP